MGRLSSTVRTTKSSDNNDDDDGGRDVYIRHRIPTVSLRPNLHSEKYYVGGIKELKDTSGVVGSGGMGSESLRTERRPHHLESKLRLSGDRGGCLEDLSDGSILTEEVPPSFKVLPNQETRRWIPSATNHPTEPFFHHDSIEGKGTPPGPFGE